MKTILIVLSITFGLATHAANATRIDGLLPSQICESESGKCNKDSNDSSDDDDSCKEPIDLENFPQWREMAGYWIGELSFYGADGTPFESANWNYPYDNYKGFITGEISGTSYRQRNIFLYPPQTEDGCTKDNATVGIGICGTNGNSKRYEADQTGNSCDGSIEGLFSVFDTKATPVGADNTLLYQVYYQGRILQSQITTFSGNGRRTRSAQGFNTFAETPANSSPTYCSFYRERKVDKVEFYATLNTTLVEYDLFDGDTCNRDSEGVLVPGVVGGFAACEAYLEESFQLQAHLANLTVE